MNEQDKIRLRHMLEAAQEALEFTAGQSQEALAANRMLARALVQDITIVGEAASRVSKETQAAHPQIPWSDIIGMRNRLIHAYFDIRLDRVWTTVQDDLPPLITELEKLLADDDE